MPGDLVETHSLSIINARLRGRDGLYSIIIDDDRITDIVDRVVKNAEYVIDAEGGLVTEPFVNPHLHLCKVYTFQLAQEAVEKYQGSSMEESLEAIMIASKVKEKYAVESVMENAEKALLEALRHGTLYIRAFADTDMKAGLTAVKALLKLREKYKGLIDLQVVAFPQDGIIRDEGTEELLWKAVELGVDVIGGIPWIEYTRSDMEKHIDIVFSIATQYDRDISMLTDDTGDPFLDTTEMLAAKTLRNKWIGRVVAHHARALALKPKPYLDRLSGLLVKASVSLVMNPHTGPLYLPFKYLLRKNVNIALGQDDISDAYYPYGRNNMLEVAFLASHTTWSMTLRDMELFYDMITWRAAKAININGYGISKDGKADLLVHRARSIYELIWYHEKPRYVIKNGKIIYEYNTVEKINL